MKKTPMRMLMATALLACAGTGALNAAELTVNSGSATNQYVPFHFYFLDNAACRAQVLYPAQQLETMAGETIREIQFYLTDEGFSGNWSADQMILSLGEYDQPELTADNGGYTEFLDIPFHTGYSGHMEGVAGGKLLKFELTDPYTYTGSNLVVQISLGSAGNAYPRAEFTGTSTETMQAAYTYNGFGTYAAGFLPATTFSYGQQAEFEASVSTTEVTFPVTMLGKSTSGSVKISNTGQQPVPVTLTLESDAFSATLPSGELAPAQAMEIPLTFTPANDGDTEAAMVLDLGQAGSFTVNLSGKGVTAPDGLVTDFNVASGTLPEGWTGWTVTETYDFDVNDYVYKSGDAGTSRFTAFSKDGINAAGINLDNPVRQYPDRLSFYMISPAVEGDIMLQLASYRGSDSFAASSAKVFKATMTADGNWIIDSTPLDFSWLAEAGNNWGLMNGTVSQPAHLAIQLSSMAIATFAAETDASASVGKDYDALVSDDAVDFGQVLVGQTASKAITVTNTGSKAFDLAVGDIAEGPFSAAVSQAVVEPAMTATVTVTFTPAESGTYNLPLEIVMGEAGTKTVDLTAVAVGAVVGSEFTVDGVTYTVVSQTEAGVSAVSSDLTECNVPATVTNPDGITLSVVSVEREAFYWSNVTKVTLPEGLHTIAYGAFRSSPLAEIKLPSTLTSIGDYAFRTTSLTSVVIPDGVSVIGSSVFASCEQLSQITLPASLTAIGSGAFYKTALTSVEIPSGCTEIGIEAFELCESLNNITLPEGLTEISSMLFLGCSSLTDIEIPASVTAIGTRAFEETGITDLRLPAALSAIASSSFNGTPVASVSVDPANTSFKVVDGALYDYDGHFLYLCPRSGVAETFTVAEGCRGIVGGAFYECPVRKVILPESLIGIDEYTFCLSALEEINLPDNIFLIGTQAFAATRLSEVVLPAALEAISDGLFASCGNLTSVTIGAAVETIGNRAFYNCQALTEIIALGEEPAEFDMWEALTDPFLNVDCDKITVYCPDGESVLAAYKASEWADFFANIKNISDRPESGIEAPVANGNATSANIYTVQGQLVISTSDVNEAIKSLTPGIYIISTPSGSYKISIR
ncbi:MAG: leucine-rich repeat protein [Muribaculaceae bacterium]|nr:leucine-rich repeat protein [Muribaculaceae bacterium]